MAMPSRMHAAIVSGTDIPIVTIIVAATAPITATTDPTERSISPVRMQGSIPIARIKM